MTPRAKLWRYLKRHFAKADRTKNRVGQINIPDFDPLCHDVLKCGNAPIPVRLLATPEIFIPIKERPQVLASWCESLVSAGDRKPVFEHFVPQVLIDYAAKYKNHPGAMLYALGNEVEVDIKVWRRGMSVTFPGHKPFGIDSDRLIHRSGGLAPGAFDQLSWLAMLKGYPLKHGDVGALYRYTTSDMVKSAICAMLRDNDARAVSQIFSKSEALETIFPTVEQADKIAFDALDPYAEMYIRLIPKTVTVKVFTRLFPKWEARRKYGLTQIHRVEIFDRIISLGEKLYEE